METKENTKTPFYKLPVFWTSALAGVLAVLLLIACSSNFRYNEKFDKYEKYKEEAKAAEMYEDLFLYVKEKDPTLASEAIDYRLNKNTYGSYSTSSETSSSTTTSSSTSTALVYKVGESVKFKNGLTITVNSVTEDTSRELNEESGTPVVVNFTMKNDGSDQFDFSPYDFNVLDGQNNVANIDSTSYRTNYPDYLNSGQTLTADIIFAAKNSGPYQVTVGDVTWKTK